MKWEIREKLSASHMCDIKYNILKASLFYANFSKFPMHLTEPVEVKGSIPTRAIALNNYINGQVLYDSLYAKADRVSMRKH